MKYEINAENSYCMPLHPHIFPRLRRSKQFVCRDKKKWVNKQTTECSKSAKSKSHRQGALWHIHASKRAADQKLELNSGLANGKIIQQMPLSIQKMCSIVLIFFVAFFSSFLAAIMKKFYIAKYFPIQFHYVFSLMNVQIKSFRVYGSG